MIQLNETAASSLNVLAESELDQVVGGYCHKGRKHGGWGYGYGGKRDHEKRGCSKRDYEGERGYDDSSDYDRTDGSGDSFEVNNQVIQLDITINQVAV